MEIQSAERGCCARWEQPQGFSKPDVMLHCDFSLLSVSVVTMDVVANMHNWIMSTQQSKYIKIPAVVLLSITLLPIFVIAIAESATRLVLALLTSPLLCCGDSAAVVPTLLLVGSVISLAAVANNFLTIGSMYITNENIDARRSSVEMAQHVTIEQLIWVALAFFCRGRR